MGPAGYAAVFFTVVLLVATAYFFMGGLPLLILPHDTPLDSRFIGRFFDIYYKAAVFAAAGAAVAYLLWGRLPFAAGAGVIAVLAFVLRQRVLPTMTHLAARIKDNDATALRTFRGLHSVALLVNLALLIGLVWGITQLSI